MHLLHLDQIDTPIALGCCRQFFLLVYFEQMKGKPNQDQTRNAGRTNYLLQFSNRYQNVPDKSGKIISRIFLTASTTNKIHVPIIKTHDHTTTKLERKIFLVFNKISTIKLTICRYPFHLPFQQSPPETKYYLHMKDFTGHKIITKNTLTVMQKQDVFIADQLKKCIASHCICSLDNDILQFKNKKDFKFISISENVVPVLNEH